VATVVGVDRLCVKIEFHVSPEVVNSWEKFYTKSAVSADFDMEVYLLDF